MAISRLAHELRSINKDPNYYYSIMPNDDNFFKWDFNLIGPNDTLYEGGIFKGYINFTKEYPIKPPVVIFHNIIHPNIHLSGEVCISILHEGADTYGYEKDSERWTPMHGIDSIMLSIISMLSDPNFESPANINASVLWKDNKEEYMKKIYKLVSESQK
jgi:ubiquitin-conjugating enzyme E2 G1